MKKYIIDKKKLFFACLFSGSIAFIPNVSEVDNVDAYYDGNKIVIDDYGTGKIEINRDMFDRNMEIGDVFITMDDDKYDYYLKLASEHEEEMPYYCLSAFGILSSVGVGTIVISKVLKKNGVK